MTKAKKSLGQNFLISPYPIKDILNTAELKKGDTVLEIGPGKGVLTENLLLSGAKVICVEKDKDLIPLLQEKFKKQIKKKELTLVEGDILDIEIDKIINQKYKLVANIPYYITGSILRKFLEEKTKPEQMVLLVQKEVAQRIVAKDKKESLLSLSVKFFGEPIYIRTVSKGSFLPKPKVDSAILNIKNIKDNNFPSDFFFKIIHLAFKHKRKQLLPNLAEVFSKDKLILLFDELNINPKTRAENLPINVWINICQKLKSL